MPLKQIAIEKSDPPTLAGGTSNTCFPAILRNSETEKLKICEIHQKSINSVMKTSGIKGQHAT